MVFPNSMGTSKFGPAVYQIGKIPVTDRWANHAYVPWNLANFIPYHPRDRYIYLYIYMNG